jgi:hypothetical protein
MIQLIDQLTKWKVTYNEAEYIVTLHENEEEETITVTTKDGEEVSDVLFNEIELYVDSLTTF